MTQGLIAEMGFITIQTTRLDEQVTMTREILGLREVERVGNAVYFAAADVHHEIVYVEGDRDGLDHLSFRARDESAFQEIRRRVIDAGMPILTDAPLSIGITEAFSFIGPEGYIFEIYLQMTATWTPTRPSGPERYGHINMHPVDVVRMKSFFVDVLDFRVSDVVGTDFAYFLRCNSDHHGIALIKGRGSLHHHAWQTQSIADLGRMADRVDRMGQKLLWGPVRHGAGHNIAAYYEEPSGALVELYTDMEQIYDDAREPNIWPGDDDLGWVNRWMDFTPSGFRDFGIFPVSRPADH
ncbi:VOC family protein [Arthrobacter luteolus]|uniref:VOC family protein n=1 Tax=Arthrobacter luteolus TaxID=98672 RepID=UPI00384F70F8